MIIRARPKYLNVKMIEDCISDICLKYQLDLMYFNSGRAALKFFLKEYAKIKEKSLNILIQSFNCHVVVDAALEAGCIVHLIDIKKSDFSIDYNYICNYPAVDVLLLTHYQGIPNIQYEAIIKFAKSNKILVIEDMSQTYGSTIEGKKVGTLGDLFTESYAFDKPFSSMYGGALGVNDSACLSSKFLEVLRTSYHNLPVESNRIADKHMYLLRYVFSKSESCEYHKYRYINQYDLMLHLVSTGKIERYIKYIVTVYSLLKIKKIHNTISKIAQNNDLIDVERLNPRKIRLIEKQKEKFVCHPLPEWCLQFVPNFESKIKICWNRFSVLDNNEVIKKRILNKFNNKIEIGNFNWQTVLHHKYEKHKSVIIKGNFENTEYCAKNILNIPIWQALT